MALPLPATCDNAVTEHPGFTCAHPQPTAPVIAAEWEDGWEWVPNYGWVKHTVVTL